MTKVEKNLNVYNKWVKLNLGKTYGYNSRKFKLTSTTEYSDGIRPN
jgi:hypothetical protein